MKKGEPYKETDFRKFEDLDGKYLERWDLLK